MVNPPSTDQIYQNIINGLKQNTGITATTSSSVASGLAASFSVPLASLWEALSDVDRSLSIDTAIGPELDRLGEFLGVSRLQANNASTLGYGPALILKNNGSTSITVPANTAIFPANQTTIVFRTNNAVTIVGNQSSSVDITAQGSGPQYNVAALALNSHNAGIAQLSVFNPRTIDSGTDSESDDSYRGRLYQSTNLREPGSKTSIRLNLSTLPGVREARILENTGGAGTFDVLLIGQGAIVPAESISAALSYLDEFAPAGVAYRVITPKLLPIDITASLVLTSGEEVNRSSLTAIASQAIRSYIDSLSVEDNNGEGEFIFSELIERIGTSVLTAKDYSVNVTVNDRPLVFGNNYKPQQGERLVPRRIRVD